MKKVFLLLIALLSALVFTSCSGSDFKDRKDSSSLENANNSEIQTPIEVSLWTFPVGNWGNPTAMTSLMSKFHKNHPDISVSIEYLTYDNGDEKIEQAIADGTAPDLVLEGPERLVANWGDKNLLVDLSDLWESDASGMIYDYIKDACRHSSGEYYEYPICMTAHCMAINYDMFKEAGALKYIDEETHTWSTEDFINAVHALTEYGQKRVGTIYCENQSGDQGTRALVNNLYGGSFTDDNHTTYAIDSAENIHALQTLYDLEGITFEPSMASADTIELFCKKELAMSFCWNVSLEIQQTVNNPDLDFEIFPMAFPSSSGNPLLQGGIWGFGIFDNGDQERIEAAKTFIRYMTEDEEQYMRAVRTSTYWPVRDVGNIYENDMLMTEYSIFMSYMGDYYQITPDWTKARTAWWKLLQNVGAGMDVAEAVKGFPADD